MQRPNPQSSALHAAPALEAEDHVVFGPDVNVTSRSAGHGWSFESPTGGSWHVWSYQGICDQIDLPQWPAAMDQARVVLSSAMCRTQTGAPLPPFVPSPSTEHCGVHVLASAKKDVLPGAPIVAARSQMRQWLARLLGGNSSSEPGPATHSTPGPDGFIDIGDASIYHFQPHTAKSMGIRKDRLLDLAALAVGPQHFFRDLLAPRVMHGGRQWLDNYRLEISLQRTAHGFVQVAVQMISVLPPASEISIEPAENATSRIAWIGPSPTAVSFMLASGQSRPEALEIPAKFYAGQPMVSAGEVTAKTTEFTSFHPNLVVSAKADAAVLATKEPCHLEVIAALPRTYFFDPYQLQQQYDEANLGASYAHYGPVELEKPAEAVGAWGSLLVLSQSAHQTQLSATVPIHARYRVPPVQGPLVGYHGEPTKDTHVELALPPPLAAVVCPKQGPPEKPREGSGILDGLQVRPVLFDELGLVPIASLQIAPDMDLLLRMPVPSTKHASLIQVATLGLLFAGAIYTLYSAKRKMQAPA
ncbi:hypothetical protein GGF46_003552 [Coemansia sp. RSA 552]|nr:hypothetical protein GGF46_003552 [Coemansia sp. RSA 552]